MLFAMAEHLELPRPWRLMLTAGWNLAESLALPVVGYYVGAKLGGRDAGMVAATGVVWLTALGRKIVTRTVPGLLTISALVLTVQTGANPFDAPPATPPPTPQGVLMRYPGGDDHVLSGLMRGANEIRNRPAIVDQPSGKGRIIMFAGNPCYRWQNFGEFNMLFNTVLNFNDIKTEAPKPAGTAAP